MSANFQDEQLLSFLTSFLTTNNLCEFTAKEHKFKRRFCTQKSV